jgi:hypothetical protein
VSKIVLLFLTLIILSVVGYGAIITFSESREYTKISIDYYLLTPKELSELSKHCENDPRFIYSAADGPKPAIIHLHCFLEEKVISNYANKTNFERISSSQFKKGAIEMEFEKNDAEKVVVITVYEYL